MELKQKGQGGWNDRDVASQGEDALGGWGAAHATPSAADRGDDFPLRSENGSQPSTLLGQVPLRANEWRGGNAGGKIHEAGNANQGAYRGSESPAFPFPRQGSSHSNERGLIGSAHSAYSGGYASPNFNNSFPLAGQVPQQGPIRGGYQRF